MIDHDRLFKELLTTFFVEFIELFLPQVAVYMDARTLKPLDKEVFAGIAKGKKFNADVVMQVQFRGTDIFFLILVEPQSTAKPGFPRRMYRYFERLSLKYDKDVYPIALFSYDKPYRKEASSYKVTFPDLKVLNFNYRVIQLNRLNWRDYLNKPNPVASALMAKMSVAPQDRVKVKIACLRMLAGLKLNLAQQELISGFVDAYLRLNEEEEQQFETELEAVLPPEEEEDVMQIVTSWMRKGIELGKQEGEINTLLKLLNFRFGQLEPEVAEQVRRLSAESLDKLPEALFGFSSKEDFMGWLEQHQ